MALGFLIYFLYGNKRSRMAVADAEAATEADTLASAKSPAHTSTS
jgi:hypothetical protein